MDPLPSDVAARARHWDAAYDSRGPAGVSWYEDEPDTSLELIAGLGLPSDAPLLDVGGGASRLVTRLLGRGCSDLTVLDLSTHALDLAREQLGDDAPRVAWVAADVVGWEPERTYAVWHDRAVFHFLVGETQRRAYTQVLLKALQPGGYVVIGTFALDGPEECSALPVARYDADGLSKALGSELVQVTSRNVVHETPWHTRQPFTWVVLRRVGGGTD